MRETKSYYKRGNFLKISYESRVYDDIWAYLRLVIAQKVFFYIGIYPGTVYDVNMFQFRLFSKLFKLDQRIFFSKPMACFNVEYLYI